MSLEETLNTARTFVEKWSGEITAPEPERLDAVITPDTLVPAVQDFMDRRLGYLCTITGLDLGVEADALELLYHLAMGAVVVTLRVTVPRDGGVVPTICDVLPSAEPYERELIEMLGVWVEGTPNPKRLYLPDDWPEGVYPLRKDFDPGVLKD